MGYAAVSVKSPKRLFVEILFISFSLRKKSTFLYTGSLKNIYNMHVKYPPPQ